MTAAEIAAIRDADVSGPVGGGWAEGGHGHLAHGDLDATHVYHRNGAYGGISDLGHAALHDGETIAAPLLPHLLDGYADVVPLPPDHRARIAWWSVLIGVRALVRVVDRSHRGMTGHLARGVRRGLDDRST